MPEDVAKHYSAEHKDPDGQFASFRVFLCPIAYNTNLVKKEEAPKSYADLLDPKWAGKIVKAHPSYSGTILTATYQMARDIGWEYFEKLAKQSIMQVQSASDPPKKLALGERAIMADGVEYVCFQHKEKGDPVELVYPTEGTPLIIGPNAIFKNAPNPNAARLLQSYMFSAECQQLCIDVGGLALGARADQGKARPHAAEGHQADEGRRGGGREGEREHQEALHAVVQGVNARCQRPRASSSPACGGGLGRGHDRAAFPPPGELRSPTSPASGEVTRGATSENLSPRALEGSTALALAGLPRRACSPRRRRPRRSRRS